MLIQLSGHRINEMTLNYGFSLAYFPFLIFSPLTYHLKYAALPKIKEQKNSFENHDLKNIS